MATREASGRYANIDRSQKAAGTQLQSGLQLPFLAMTLRGWKASLCRIVVQAVARRLLNLRDVWQAPESAAMCCH